MNLTSVTAEQVVPRHFLDSLAAQRAVDLSGGGRLIDVGTGAGFPGIPLKIAFPSLQITLLDSTRKRLTFLDAVIADLGLERITTVHSRAEDAARLPAHRAQYDFATARAVAPLERLAGWMIPFLRPGGIAIALKSEDAEEEIGEAGATIRKLGARTERVVMVRIPGTEIDRRIAVLRKNQRTENGGRRGSVA